MRNNKIADDLSSQVEGVAGTDGADDDDGSSGNRFGAWASLVADWSSCHGVAWYNRTSVNFIRVSAFALIMVIMLGLPAVILLELVDFVRDVRLSDTVFYTSAEVIRYPNLTFCHSRYFDKDRMQG